MGEDPAVRVFHDLLEILGVDVLGPLDFDGPEAAPGNAGHVDLARGTLDVVGRPLSGVVRCHDGLGQPSGLPWLCDGRQDLVGVGVRGRLEPGLYRVKDEGVGEHDFSCLLGGAHQSVFDQRGLDEHRIHRDQEFHVIRHRLGMVDGEFLDQRVPGHLATDSPNDRAEDFAEVVFGLAALGDVPPNPVGVGRERRNPDCTFSGDIVDGREISAVRQVAVESCKCGFDYLGRYLCLRCDNFL